MKLCAFGGGSDHCDTCPSMASVPEQEARSRGSAPRKQHAVALQALETSSPEVFMPQSVCRSARLRRPSPHRPTRLPGGSRGEPRAGRGEASRPEPPGSIASARSESLGEPPSLVGAQPVMGGCACAGVYKVVVRRASDVRAWSGAKGPVQGEAGIGRLRGAAAADPDGGGENGDQGGESRSFLQECL